MFHRGLALRRRWFFLLTLLAFALMLIIGGILWHSVGTSSVSEIHSRISALKPLFTGFRLFLIALVAMAWPLLTSSLHCWGRIDEGQRDTLDNLRWRVVTWLVVIELVLGQNLAGQVLALLQGSRA
ncbi:MAG: hypothetical protein KZQ96_13790 [Candidatus Thiodiazotropha sp. (ex Lucinoma borealis)]|nr:hypothetical protein [Candidatus Thiodiazotropha sp. (ex Lucinoma borealis)]